MSNWSLRSIFTFTNICNAIILWNFISPFLMLETKNDVETTSISPPTKQHFEFHPVGYTYRSTAKNTITKYTSTVNQTSAKHSGDQTNKIRHFKTLGFYEKDSQALFRVIQDVIMIKAKEEVNLFAKTEEIEEAEECSNSTADTSAKEKTSLIENKSIRMDGSTSNGGNNSDIVLVLNLIPGENPQSHISYLRNVVTFLIGFYEDLRSFTREGSPNFDTELKLEVVLILKSHGGSVAAYGLLSDQLRRLRSLSSITLTVACDQAALSGGYMLASLATPGHLLAAPFASIGSIGAKTSTVFNVREFLEHWGVTMATFKGGKYKDPMNMFADISDDEREHMQCHIDSFHRAFSDHVRAWRGDVIQEYETVTSGAYWTGIAAKDLGLVDKILTSDDYIDQKIRSGSRVLNLQPKQTKQKEKSTMHSIMDFIFNDPTNYNSELELNSFDISFEALFEASSLSHENLPRNFLVMMRAFLSKILNVSNE